MPDSTTLAGLLDRVGHVFSLAGQLGEAFHERAQRRVSWYDPSAWATVAPAFDEFYTALLDLRDAMQRPPDGFAPVGQYLLEAARIAKEIRAGVKSEEDLESERERWKGDALVSWRVRSPGPPAFTAFGEFSDRLGEVCKAGREQVNKARRLDDPFAFVDQPTPGKEAEIDTTSTLPKRSADRDTLETSLPGPGYMPARAPSNNEPTLPDSVRNWLIGHYLSDPTPGRMAEADPEPVVFVRYDTFKDFLLDAGYELLPNLDAWKDAGWIEDVMVDIEPTGDPKDSPPYCIARLNLTLGRHRLVGIRRSVFNASAASTSLPGPPEKQHDAAPAVTPTKPAAKRSTERGEGRAKLISALTKHHQYADDSCLNLNPIGNNELAKAAGVSTSTASTFFNDEFQGHGKYKALCRTKAMLVAALKLLNDEFAPYHLFGTPPPDLATTEDDRDDDK